MIEEGDTDVAGDGETEVCTLVSCTLGLDEVRTVGEFDVALDGEGDDGIMLVSSAAIAADELGIVSRGLVAVSRETTSVDCCGTLFVGRLIGELVNGGPEADESVFSVAEL